MGKASRRKRQRRESRGLELPRNIIPEFRDSRFRTPRDRPKISEALITLIEPFISDDDSIERFRMLATFGAIAWNYSLFEEGTAPPLGDFDKAGIFSRQEMEQFIFSLVSRKQSLFPDDKRLVVGWEAVVKPDGSFFLTAATVVEEGE